MMLTQQSQVRKCVLKCKTEVYKYCTKEAYPIRKPDQEIEGMEHFK